MDLMHLPRLESIGVQDKGKAPDTKQKQATSPLDSAYASSEDGSNSPASVHRSSRTRSSGIASASSRTSLITEIDDDLPPSRSITPDSTFRTHSPLSRDSSVEGWDSGFTATLHEPGDINVIVRVTSEPDGDTISCDEDEPLEVIDKLFQTVALPMLWNLPDTIADFSLFPETTEEIKEIPVPKNEIPIPKNGAPILVNGIPDPKAEGISLSKTEEIPVPKNGFPITKNGIPKTTGPIVIDVIDAVSDETDDSEPTLTFHQKTTNPALIEGEKVFENGTEQAAFSRGCLNSSRRQLQNFFAYCRDYFTSKSFNVRL